LVNITWAATLRRRCATHAALRSERLVATLRWAAAAANQQFGHRAAVTSVALQRAQQLLAAGILHRSRVEFHDLQASRAQPSHECPVIVTCGLNADPHDDGITVIPGAGDGCIEHSEPGLGQPKLERHNDDLAVVVGDQGDRAGLAHVDRDHQTPLRLHATDPGHELGLKLAVDECHHHSHLSDVTDSASEVGRRRAGASAWRAPLPISSTAVRTRTPRWYQQRYRIVR